MFERVVDRCVELFEIAYVASNDGKPVDDGGCGDHGVND